jgi:hypothetical protein
MDQFMFEYINLGYIHKIRIRHDNEGKHPDWFLKLIEIVVNDKEKYVFICNKWLSISKDDMVIERILYEEKYDGERESTSVESTKKPLKNIKKSILLPFYYLINTRSI